MTLHTPCSGLFVFRECKIAASLYGIFPCLIAPSTSRSAAFDVAVIDVVASVAVDVASVEVDAFVAVAFAAAFVADVAAVVMLAFVEFDAVDVGAEVDEVGEVVAAPFVPSWACANREAYPASYPSYGAVVSEVDLGVLE